MLATSTQPRIEVRATWPCVYIPARASLSEWNKAIEKIPQLFAWIELNGVTPRGPLFFRYRTIGDTETPFDLEIGIAVTEPVDGSGEVSGGEIPGGTYVTAIHEGHPDQMDQTWETIANWIEQQDLAPARRTDGGREVLEARFEFFLTNPDEQPDPNQWFTELAWLVEKKQGASQ